MRGSFCQALPIGCIRVFMTPSCSSAVTLDSRCSGTLNSVSSLRRMISSSWLRVRTSSDTIVIRCSSVSTLTRIDWLATRSPSDASGSTNGFLRGRLWPPSATLRAAQAPAVRRRRGGGQPRSRSRGTRAPVHRATLRRDAIAAPASDSASVPCSTAGRPAARPAEPARRGRTAAGADIACMPRSTI